MALPDPGKDVDRVEPVLAASITPGASLVEGWMAERRDVVPAVGFSPAIVERNEPEP